MKRLVGIFVFAAVSIFGARASAQGMGGATGTSGPSFGRPDVEATPESGPVKQAKNSVKLFDVYRSILAYQMDVGPIWDRRASNTTPLSRRTNFEHRAPLAGELAFGSVLTTPSFKGPFYLTSEQLTVFRVLDAKSFAWSVFSEKLGGGVVLGPVEIEARIGVHALTVDIMHAQPSIELLSPRIEAGIGLHLGKIRVDIKGHSEYLWRWFGPDYVIRGVTLGLRFDRSHPKNPYPGAPPEE